MSISEQVKELRYKADIYNTVGSVWELNRAEAKRLQEMLRQAAGTIESLSAKLADMERPAEDCGGGWIPCSEPPKHNNEVLIFNGKSYSVGYYDGKTWVNTIHPVEWQEIKHEP